MKKVLSLLMGVLIIMSILTVYANAAGEGYLVVTDFIQANSGKDVSDDIQALIEANPNRTLFFPDGEYLLSKPIKTPAMPKRSVCLKLSDYATFRPIGEWTKGEALIQLGAEYPANDTRTPGSNYSLEGGIIDGKGVADGISINGGRETAVRFVSIKNTVVGIHIFYGANSGSSDADISDLNIIGSGTTDSIGILSEGYDNTFTNIRIGFVYTGVYLKGGGNSLKNIHPLYQLDYTDYENSCGFLEENGDNLYDYCYSDQFGTGFRLTNGSKSRLSDCFCFWYSPNGDSHTAIRADKKFNAVVTNMRIGFPDSNSNYVLKVGQLGGSGKLNNIIASNDIASNTYKAYAFNDKPFDLIVRIFYKIILAFTVGF